MENTDPVANEQERREQGNREPQERVPADGAQPGTTDGDALAARLAECERELAGMRELVLRERADVDNQRKRMQRDLEHARRFANEKLLADLLPVLDNLERGLAAQGADADALRGGVELTLRELVRVVEANGLQSVDPAGQPFDPDRHHAMNMVEGSGQPPGTVAGVFQKGYVLNDRLLRPAMVSVEKESD